MFEKITNLITYLLHHARGGHPVKWGSWESYVYYNRVETPFIIKITFR